MILLLTAMTFLIVAGILLASFVLAGGGKPDNIVRARLEAIEKGERRGNASLELQLVRDELLSDVPVVHRFLMRWSWSKWLKAFIGQAGMRTKPGKLALLSGALGMSAFIALHMLYRNPLITVLVTVCSALLPL